jgi:hypothetical protein
MADGTGQITVDTPSDFGTDEQSVCSRWKSELELSEKDQKPWVTRGRQIIKRYIDRSNSDPEGENSKRRRYSLLYSNIQTLAPACYARTPTAVVSRRWKDADPIGRQASEVIERALNFQLDACDFADMMTSLRDEFLLVARGQAWVRYVPHMATVPGKPVEPEDGEETNDTADEYDVVVWEECIPDHVHWEDFGTNPARTWSEVRFVWRRAYMTRDELIARFGKEKGKACPLDWKANSETGDTDKDTQFSKAGVYEIWDKITKKVFWVCKAFEVCLDVRDDPLGLKDFFPCPRPLLGTHGPDSIIPTPDYVYYESQAQEINELTKRIGLLIDALKVRGFYPGKENEKLTDLLSSENNTLIPIEGFSEFVQGGGAKGMIEWVPVDMVADVLKGCIETRQQMLEDVWQITGIADIMRGDSDPNETATAQELKSNWGSSRVRDKQKEIARFARDLLRIMGEVISSKFSTDTLSKMTGVKMFPSPQAKQQAMQQLQPPAPPPPMPGQPPAPATPPPLAPSEAMQRLLEDPTWEEVEALLHDNALRTFRIEIETDSTIEPNDQQEKQRRIEFVEAVAQYLEKTSPIVSLAPPMLPVVMEGLKFLVRGFRVGREMEDVIEQAADQLEKLAQNAPPPQHGKPGDPPQLIQAKVQDLQASAQAKTVNAQADMLRAHNDVQKTQIDAHLDAGKIQAEDQRSRDQMVSDHAMQQTDIRADLQKALIGSETKRLSRDISEQKPIQAPTR